MSSAATDYSVNLAEIIATGTDTDDSCTDDVGNAVNISLPPNDEVVSQNKWLYGGTVEGNSPGPQWAFLALGIFPVWMLAGNCLVLLALLLQRNLQNLSNRVIASLAVTDFLLALFVVPLSIYQLVHGRWELGFYVCLAWTGSDVILSTASIMHLCAIALHRYHGIAHPLRMRCGAGALGGIDGGLSGGVGSSGSRRVAALVGPAWGIAVALSIPFLVQAVLDRSYVLIADSTSLPTEKSLNVSARSERPEMTSPLPCRPETTLGGIALSATAPTASSLLSQSSPPLSCGIFNRPFAVYSSMVSFFIPLGVMIVADFRSVQILRKNIHFSFPVSIGRTTAIAAAATKTGRSTFQSGSGHDRKLEHGPRIARSFSTTSTPSRRKWRWLTKSKFCRGYCYGAAMDDENGSEQDKQVESELLANNSTTSALSTTTSFSPAVPSMRSLLSTDSCDRTAVEQVEDEYECDTNTRDEVVAPSSTSGTAADGNRPMSSLSPGNQSNTSPATFAYRGRSRSKSMVYIDMLASCGSTKVNGRERRAEKTLIWVFAAFVALWLPFFCANLAYGLCGIGVGGRRSMAADNGSETGSSAADDHTSAPCDVPPNLFTAFTWLGYLSSGVNPCIYTLLNRDFRSAFRYLVTCRHGHLRRKCVGGSTMSRGGRTVHALRRDRPTSLLDSQPTLTGRLTTPRHQQSATNNTVVPTAAVTLPLIDH